MWISVFRQQTIARYTGGNHQGACISGSKHQTHQGMDVERLRIKCGQIPAPLVPSIFGKCQIRPSRYGGALQMLFLCFLEQVSGFSTVESSYPQFSTTYPQLACQPWLL